MGISQSNDKFKQISQDYRIVNKFNDPRYGEVRLLEHNENSEQVILKEISMNDEKLYENFIQNVKRRQMNSCESIIQIKNFYYCQEKQLCSAIYKIYILFEYIPDSLISRIKQNQSLKTYFTADELWIMIESSIQALAAFQTMQVPHQNIRPQTLSIQGDIQRGNFVLKICDTPLLTNVTAFGAVLQDYTGTIKGYFLSPILVKAVYDSNVQPIHDPYKSDVFSLGMTLMYAALLQSCDRCYLMNMGEVNELEVNDMLEKIKHLYSQDLYTIISMMLVIDENNRPDFLQLFSILFHEKNEQIDPISLYPDDMTDQFAHITPPQPFINDSIHHDSNTKSIQMDIPDKIENINHAPSDKVSLISQNDVYQCQELSQRQSVDNKQNYNLHSQQDQQMNSPPKLYSNRFSEGKQQNNQVQSRTNSFQSNYKIQPNIKSDYIEHKQEIQRTNYIPNYIENKQEIQRTNYLENKQDIQRSNYIENKQEIQRNNYLENKQEIYKSNYLENKQDIQRNNYLENKQEIYKSKYLENKQDIQRNNYVENKQEIQRNNYLKQSELMVSQKNFLVDDNLFSLKETLHEYIVNFNNKFYKYPPPAIKQSNFQSNLLGMYNIPPNPEPFKNNYIQDNYQPTNYLKISNSKYNDFTPVVYTPTAPLITDQNKYAYLHDQNILEPRISNDQNRQIDYSYAPISNQDNFKLKNSQQIPITMSKTIQPQLQDYQIDKYSYQPKEYTQSTYQQPQQVPQKNDLYAGDMMNGMRNGYGKLKFPNGGGYYEGYWKDDKMNGIGTLYYGNGKPAYDGQWVADKFEGQGALYNESPEVLQKPFNFQDFDVVDNYWSKYIGGFKDDCKHGYGTLYLSNGEYIEGQFYQDLLEGEGKFYQTNGMIVRGIWKQNLLSK